MMEARELVHRSRELAKQQADVHGGRIVEVAFLQPGEDPESADLDDARLWASVYAELAAFKRSLLEHLHASMRNATNQLTIDELKRDEQLWLIELERLDLHLRFWQARVAR